MNWVLRCCDLGCPSRLRRQPTASHSPRREIRGPESPGYVIGYATGERRDPRGRGCRLASSAIWPHLNACDWASQGWALEVPRCSIAEGRWAGIALRADANGSGTGRWVPVLRCARSFRCSTNVVPHRLRHRQQAPRLATRSRLHNDRVWTPFTSAPMPLVCRCLFETERARATSCPCHAWHRQYGLSSFASSTTMAREYELNEPLSPLALFDAAQRRAIRRWLTRRCIGRAAAACGGGFCEARWRSRCRRWAGSHGRLPSPRSASWPRGAVVLISMHREAQPHPSHACPRGFPTMPPAAAVRARQSPRVMDLVSARRQRHNAWLLELRLDVCRHAGNRVTLAPARVSKHSDAGDDHREHGDAGQDATRGLPLGSSDLGLRSLLIHEGDCPGASALEKAVRRSERRVRQVRHAGCRRCPAVL